MPTRQGKVQSEINSFIGTIKDSDKYNAFLLLVDTFHDFGTKHNLLGSFDIWKNNFIEFSDINQKIIDAFNSKVSKPLMNSKSYQDQKAMRKIRYFGFDRDDSETKTNNGNLINSTKLTFSKIQKLCLGLFENKFNTVTSYNYEGLLEYSKNKGYPIIINNDSDLMDDAIITRYTDSIWYLPAHFIDGLSKIPQPSRNRIITFCYVNQKESEDDSGYAIFNQGTETCTYFLKENREILTINYTVYFHIPKSGISSMLLQSNKMQIHVGVLEQCYCSVKQEVVVKDLTGIERERTSNTIKTGIKKSSKFFSKKRITKLIENIKDIKELCKSLSQKTFTDRFFVTNFNKIYENNNVGAIFINNDVTDTINTISKKQIACFNSKNKYIVYSHSNNLNSNMSNIKKLFIYKNSRFENKLPSINVNFVKNLIPTHNIVTKRNTTQMGKKSYEYKKTGFTNVKSTNTAEEFETKNGLMKFIFENYGSYWYLEPKSTNEDIITLRQTNKLVKGLWGELEELFMLKYVGTNNSKENSKPLYVYGDTILTNKLPENVLEISSSEKKIYTKVYDPKTKVWFGKVVDSNSEGSSRSTSTAGSNNMNTAESQGTKRPQEGSNGRIGKKLKTSNFKIFTINTSKMSNAEKQNFKKAGWINDKNTSRRLVKVFNNRIIQFGDQGRGFDQTIRQFGTISNVPSNMIIEKIPETNGKYRNQWWGKFEMKNK